MLSRVFLILPLLVFGALGLLVLPHWAAPGVVFLVLFFATILNLYPDKFLLHFFQAREGTETGHSQAYRVVNNQAFKLKISPPRIYTYSGFFHRAFAFSSGKRSVFIVEKDILAQASGAELEALWFSLALQVQDQTSRRSTLALLALAVWWVPFLRLAGLWKRPPLVLSWAGQFLVAPVAMLLHRQAFGSSSSQKFLTHLQAFPSEAARLRELNARFVQPRLHLSVARDVSFRIGAAAHGPREQMILALESAAHPLDFLAPPALEGHA